MPHSYGASLAADGRRGASSRDGAEAERRRRRTREDGQHDDRQVLAHRLASLSRPGRRRASAVAPDDRVAAVQQPAQREEDRCADADGQHERRLAARAEVADHVHVLVLAGLVDHGGGRRPARLGAGRHERRRPRRRRSAGSWQKARKSRVADLRLALAAGVEHVDGAGTRRRRTRRSPRGTRRPPPTPGRTPGSASSSGAQPSSSNWSATIVGLLREGGVLGNLDAARRARRPGTARRCPAARCGRAPPPTTARDPSGRCRRSSR